MKNVRRRPYRGEPDDIAIRVAFGMPFLCADGLAIEEMRCGDAAADLTVTSFRVLENDRARVADALAAAKPRSRKVEIFVQEVAPPMSVSRPRHPWHAAGNTGSSSGRVRPHRAAKPRAGRGRRPWPGCLGADTRRVPARFGAAFEDGMMRKELHVPLRRCPLRLLRSSPRPRNRCRRRSGAVPADRRLGCWRRFPNWSKRASWFEGTDDLRRLPFSRAALASPSTPDIPASLTNGAALPGHESGLARS